MRLGLPPCFCQKLLVCLPRDEENDVDEVDVAGVGVEDCRKIPPPAKRKLLRPILVTFPLPPPLATLRKLTLPMLRLFVVRCCINGLSAGSLLLPPAVAAAAAATPLPAYLVLASLLKLRLLSPIVRHLLLP